MWFEVFAFILALLLVAAVFKFIYEFNIKKLILNAIAGLVSLLILNILGIGIPINVITIFIIAITGIVGLIIILLFHFLGIAF
ncbi:MAG: pro-sigmaK processing inhibitor BofA family protein [Candidatus Anstonellales archaeon]